MSGQPVVLDLFSGIGGFSLGLERAGFRIGGHVEIDPWCRRILERHWPHVPKHDDVRTFDGFGWQPDLLTAGFPCQPVSNAGRRRAQDDERWLWPEVHRVIRLLRPRYVLLENVPGLLARGFGDVLGDLAESGYDAEWDCIPASAIGAPHRRDRVWIVAYPDSEGPQGHGRPDVCAREQPAPPRGLPAGDGATWKKADWSDEPVLLRMADGVSERVDRLRGLGNAVVPQVVELIGRRLMEVM